MVKLGETALVVQPGDIQALAKAIGVLAGNPDLRRKMGENGKAYTLQHFDPWQSAQDIQSSYDKILSK